MSTSARSVLALRPGFSARPWVKKLAPVRYSGLAVQRTLAQLKSN
jgi:hypothetical protein